MREIAAEKIVSAVRDLCIQANRRLPSSVECCLRDSVEKETSPLAKEVLCDLIKNFEAADELSLPICQDTGMAVVFAEVGQEVHIQGNFEEAINEGVRQGYTEGLLRCSVVKDPIRRGNTGDNTPAVLHLRLVEGDKIRLTVAPKGFGSENMSRMKMFTPSATAQDIIDFVSSCVETAGSNPCPPVIVGVGIGGDFEKCAYLAKAALCRDLDQRNSDPFYRDLEEKMLESINRLGVGPQGFGGKITALGVNIETYPTHIAGLPVAVNMGCHVTRHQSVEL